MTENLKGISGSMFAGKTELLLKEISRTEMAGYKVHVFKPSIDTRWGLYEIHSHSGGSHAATPINHPYEIIEQLETDADLVAIDEIQFFEPEIIDVVRFLLDQDIRVIFAGLALDFRGESFGSMPDLLALCDEIERPSAICQYPIPEKKTGKCGAGATRTQRIVNGQPANYNDPIVLIGASQEYEARCPNHHEVPGKPKPKIK
ncbi:hypothetical protein A3K29_00835 [Candidatus Collierbacteria bacterium RIFOXYB2_FULL_46_14]|uniref:Thymidine kinase n=1 Tax=Candidatus Collierbacteria bacterium GW2011_GWA2_46_26 TaxID=1618381 RepID=A0A0G1PKK5_9BACT|nr:MAG: thymidine kinase [Candidatus Collierbacteria bacterium GW2011_GWC2_44_13]KKU33261.1 MAG: thymidine kinase [Candidatus Collierbacteria bacterium GW2011_GWA2_46_26]OGD72683.1 MAG: hypothetical protein A3K29_00835 [Candidatus Collierbacteria bacterium RIFOXYB2_FULL_46_14]OGD75725.1 MAG: hypothetical protein A3K43_00835 [Candidatus Collierbacteria bacterium RIFOXYA2_FULL_46_20]OGD77061.1 MAG: hypothetical protein A3K39_00835 [Candidatus Collierbacteria bacterium RIFOXYC2_FULL_43_15]OGD8035